MELTVTFGERVAGADRIRDNLTLIGEIINTCNMIDTYVIDYQNVFVKIHINELKSGKDKIKTLIDALNSQKEYCVQNTQDYY